MNVNYVDVRQAARLLNLSIHSIHYYIKTKKLIPNKLKGKAYFDINDIMRLKAVKNNKPSYTMLKNLSNNVAIKARYIYNVSYFDTIDTEEKAYFLGLLFADGCNKGRKGIKLKLKEDDRYMLELLRDKLVKGKPLYYEITKGSKAANQFTLELNNQYLQDKLNQYGLVPRKSFILEYPDSVIPEYLTRHFIRGFFDGNGSIHNRRSQISITSTEMFLIKVAEILKNELNIDSQIVIPDKTKNDSIRRLVIYSNIDTRIFLNWLYYDSNIYLIRKFDRYLNLNLHSVKRIRKATCEIPNCNNIKYLNNHFCRKHYKELKVIRA